MQACTSGAPPRYGTCVVRNPPFCCISSIARWASVPLPLVPQVIRSGAAFAAAIRLAMSFQGRDLWAQRIIGAVPTSITGAKSRLAS